MDSKAADLNFSAIASQFSSKFLFFSSKNSFEFQLENLRNTTEIRFAANGFQSIPTTIDVLPKPIVAGFDVWLDYHRHYTNEVR